MSSENSNNKGKAVVKEEASPLMPVGAVVKEIFDPLTPVGGVVKEEEVSPPTSDDETILDEEVLLLGGGVSEGGSPSSAPVMPTTTEWAAPLPYVVTGGPAIIPAFQENSTGMVLIRKFMHQCISALHAGDMVAANTALLLMSSLACIDGDPMQRLAFAFAEALGRRVLQMLPGLSWALQPQMTEPPAPTYKDAARRCFHMMCPFLRVAASVANHAILTAMEGEKDVHVVDLGGASASQWLDLLRLFAARAEGAPFLRLTVVSEQDGFLSRTASLLHHEAVRLYVPFMFNPVRSHIDRFTALDIAALGVYHREATVITSTLQFHRLIADVTSIEVPPAAGDGHGQVQEHVITKADALLRVLRDLSPKLMVVTEQEADHNGAGLWDRASNALDHYAALFHDLEAGGAARESPERAAVERLLLREEIMDIVARDGSSRRERHESMERWVQRMDVAGFEPAQVVSFNAFADIRLLALHMSVDGTLRFWVLKDSTYLIIYSGKTPMFSVTAWRPAARS